MSTISLDEYIEQKCTHLLFDSECFTVPVDLSKVAAKLDVREVCYEDMDAEGCVERLSAGGFRVRLKATSAPTRQRFSFAHELGHIILDEASRQAQDPTYKRFLRSSVVLDDRSEEDFANTIAGTLLMPPSFVRRAFADRLDIDLVQRVADRAKVSLSAALVRAVQVSTRPAVAFQARRVGDEHAKLMWMKSTKSVDRAMAREDLNNAQILNYLVFEPAPKATGDNIRWDWVQVRTKEFDSVQTFFGLAGVSEW